MNKINIIKEIIESHQHQKVEGVKIDVQTANIVLAVYSMLSEGAKDKFTSEPVGKMIHMARVVTQ